LEEESKDSNQAREVVIKPEELSSPVTLIPVRRYIPMYSVTGQELDSLSESNAVDVGLFGVSAAGLISFSITLVTVRNLNPWQFGGFVGIVAVCLFMSVFFGFRAQRAHAKHRSQVNRIKSERVPF